MPVLVTSKFGDDSIKTEQDSLVSPFSHYNLKGDPFEIQHPKFENSRLCLWEMFQMLKGT